MSTIIKSKRKAVVDSSSWINLNRIGLIEILLADFDLIFTSKVETELLVNNKLFYTPKDLLVYKSLKKKGLIKLNDPKKVSKELWNSLSKSSGEMQSIALALEIGSFVIVDNSAAVDYCLKNKIKIINSINLIIYYFYTDKISYSQAIEKINILKPYIKNKYIEKEITLLNSLKGGRK